MQSLQIYNSLTRQKEAFVPLVPGHVGMYVCGPTVSGESHLGHARPYVTFDVIYRYLQHLGYKVRYVRNITDAGHFEEEGRAATDKIAEKAQLEKLEPMELVQKYTNLFHWADVKKYASTHEYGKLSGRVIDELLTTTRELEGQEEKRDRADFALWKAAAPEHIMRWKSPWGVGYPGWHIECSAMATKYLGAQFDIHGGGMDLLFPHHESEIAQSTICNHQAPVRYWVHNNMITINGRKMGKSYNNVIKLTELFSGQHPILAKAFHPMTIRFFILQTHYSSTLDFSNEALLAAEKGLKRLTDAVEGLVPILNAIKDGITPTGALSASTITNLQSTLRLWLETILGLKSVQAADQEKLQGVMELLIDIRKEAKGKRDFMTSDKIRDRLAALGIQLKDEKGGGMSWTLD